MKNQQLGTMIIGALGLGFALVFMMRAPTLAARSGPAAPAVRAGGTIPITLILTPTKDTTLYESTTGNLSNGAGEFFFIGNTRSASVRRGLVAFDLAGKVPSGATIVSATLQLQMSKTNSGASTVSLHRLLANWGEGSSNATDPEGSGAPATISDATWLHTFYDTALWQTPGGDFVPTATAALSVTNVGLYQWHSPALTADVQRWLDQPTDSFGWLVMGNEAALQTAKRFGASESPTAANQPQLTIVYTIPTMETAKIYLPLVIQ